MTTIVFYALSSVAIVSLISLIGVFALSLKENLLRKGVFLMVSLAVGALFGDALIHLIPESFEQIENPVTASLLILSGILGFLILEKILRWHHGHGHDCEDELCKDDVEEKRSRVQPLGFLILTSDGLHNLIDGVIIGASYLISIEVGIATTIAIVLHEIPQEISDFGLLLHSGFSKARALLVNFLSALSAFIGVGIALLIGNNNETFIPVALALAAGSFIYIAGSDLVPELHKTNNIKQSLQQIVAILIGIGIMLLL